MKSHAHFLFFCGEIKIIRLNDAIFFIVIIFALSSQAYANQELCFQLIGIEGELAQNTQHALGINDKDTCLHHLLADEIQHKYNDSKDNIKNALQPYGYFNANIQSQLIRKGRYLLAIYTINKGKPARITSLSINIEGEGKNDTKLNHFIQHYPLTKKSIFNASEYEKAKEKLFKLAKNRGYLQSFFKNEILIYPKKYAVMIHILLQTGKRYYMGPVHYTKNIYSKKWMDTIVTFKDDQYFSSDQLNTLQKEMEESYYFKEVIFTPQFDQIDNDRIPLLVDYRAPKARSFTIGLGYGTLTGPSVKAGMNLRHLTNTGHHFESELLLSTILSSLTANYVFPGKNPLKDEWLLGINAKKFHPNAGNSKSITFTGGYSTHDKHLQKNLTLNYLIEHFSVDKISYTTARSLYPHYNINYLKADDLLNPNKGVAIGFHLRGAANKLGSSASFLQSTIHSKFIYTPFPFSKIILKNDLGLTAVKDLHNFPLSLRFFAGGMNSVRGFAENSIGPGRYLAVGSFEYRNKILNHWNIAGFYDAGIAANSLKEKWNRGVGVGIVYDTMIGPFKIYLAKAVSKNTKPYSIEFSIGPELP